MDELLFKADHPSEMSVARYRCLTGVTALALMPDSIYVIVD